MQLSHVYRAKINCKLRSGGFYMLIRLFWECLFIYVRPCLLEYLYPATIIADLMWIQIKIKCVTQDNIKQMTTNCMYWQKRITWIYNYKKTFKLVTYSLLLLFYIFIYDNVSTAPPSNGLLAKSSGITHTYISIILSFNKSYINYPVTHSS